MSSNKGAREQLIRKYGAKCMMESAGIRKVPIELRKKLKGYRKSQEILTYHHIKPVREGGKATEENGAVLKEYNHAWLESQPQTVRDEVNEKLQQYKLNFSLTHIGNNGLEIDNSGSIDLDFNIGDDCITIQAYDTVEPPRETQKKKNHSRARTKRETKRLVDEYYDSFRDTEDEGLELD